PHRNAFPTRRSSDLRGPCTPSRRGTSGTGTDRERRGQAGQAPPRPGGAAARRALRRSPDVAQVTLRPVRALAEENARVGRTGWRSEEHTSELQSLAY